MLAVPPILPAQRSGLRSALPRISFAELFSVPLGDSVHSSAVAISDDGVIVRRRYTAAELAVIESNSAVIIL